MIFNKKLFFFTCLILFVFVLPPAIIVPILLIKNPSQISAYETRSKSSYYTHHSWDVNALQKSIREKKTFVMYFGTPQCPYCRKLWTALDSNKEFQTKMKTLSQNKNQKLILFSEDKHYTSEKRNVFGKALNQILIKEKMGEKNSDGSYGIGVPFFVFFQNGKPVDKMTPDPKKIPELLNKIRNLFPD